MVNCLPDLDWLEENTAQDCCFSLTLNKCCNWIMGIWVQWRRDSITIRIVQRNIEYKPSRGQTWSFSLYFQSQSLVSVNYTVSHAGQTICQCSFWWVAGVAAITASVVVFVHQHQTGNERFCSLLWVYLRLLFVVVFPVDIWTDIHFK